MQKKEISIYIHWPFCKKKCPYCDFNSHVSSKIDHAVWEESYIKAIDFYRPILQNRQVNSIFFGGGTPSLADPKLIGRVIEHLGNICSITGAEITMEANPTSVECEKLKDFKNAGINRLSLGIQSLNDRQLSFLGREHSAAEAIAALDQVASIFDNYSFDLIYALPDQTIGEWQTELQHALQNFAPPHMSLYQLTIEEGTKFYNLYQNNKLIPLHEDICADMYEATQEIMEQSGMPAYEVSNHALAGFECRHNLCYWRYQEFVGVGPGAHGRLRYNDIFRSLLNHSDAQNLEQNVLEYGKEMLATVEYKLPQTWLNHVNQDGSSTNTGSSGIENVELVLLQQQRTEAIIMGMRLREGIAIKDMGENRQDHDDGKISVGSDIVKELCRDGLIDYDAKNSRIKATFRGTMLLNSVIANLNAI